MKRNIRRLTALFLSLLLLLGAAVPASAAAMPQGYTEQQVESLIPKAETLLGALMKQRPETADLSGTVYGTLFSDDTLNGIFTGVYGSFAKNESTLEALGIDISVQNVAQALSGYPGVYSIMENKTSWDLVLSAAEHMTWGVSSKDGFASALAAMFSPLSELLFTLLCSGTYSISLLVRINGADGYQNAVVPLLETLGCPSVRSQEDYTAAAAADRSEMVRMLVFMVFDTLDKMLEKPVDSLTRYLPPVADYLNRGGLSETLKTLMAPLQVRVAIFSLSGVSDLLKNTDMFSSSTDLTSML